MSKQLKKENGTGSINFRIQCPGDFEQLPSQSLDDPVTRTLKYDSKVYPLAKIWLMDRKHSFNWFNTQKPSKRHFPIYLSNQNNLKCFNTFEHVIKHVWQICNRISSQKSSIQLSDPCPVRIGVLQWLPIHLVWNEGCCFVVCNFGMNGSICIKILKSF